MRWSQSELVDSLNDMSALTAAPYAVNEERDVSAKDNSGFAWDESPPGDTKQEFGEEASDRANPVAALATSPAWVQNTCSPALFQRDSTLSSSS